MSKRVDRGRRQRLQSRRPARPGTVVVPAGRAPGGTPSLEDRLARLLDAPHLGRLVPHLPADALHQLIRYRGLDACVEVLAAATREQISSVLDVDLWCRTQPKSDEHFDPARFGEWVETLVATDEALAARIVSRIDERLVIAGLSTHIRVFDPITRMVSQQGDEPVIDDRGTPLHDLTSEVGGYLVTARRTDAWDAIVALLLSLEADHRGSFDTVMRGCRRLSNSIPEVDGCDDLLMEPEQLLHDLALARQARRSGQGYLSPAEARMVLELARRPPLGARAASFSIRMVAADYLQIDGEAAMRGGWPEGWREFAAARSTAAENRDSIESVVELLAEAGLGAERPRALLEGTAGQPSRVERMRALLAHVHDADDSAYAARSRELAFLANTLMAGCSIRSRPFTAVEASDAAVAVCNLGLEEWQAGRREGETRELPPAGQAVLPDMFLADHDLIPVFQLGWTALHEMSMSVADRLVTVLQDVRCVDAETQQGLVTLRRELVTQCTAGTPWRARDALDVIAILDMPAWVSLLGVLDECPVLPAALTATLERRTGAVSATAFEFISTSRQIAEVRSFAAKLVGILLSS